MSHSLGIQLDQCTSIEGLQKVVEKLYDLLDDIDTAGDIAKSNDRQYRNLVEQLQQKKSNFVRSDGFKLYVSPHLGSSPPTSGWKS